MQTLGVPEPKIVAKDPALAGAQDDDIVAGSHRRDDAAAPGSVPLEGINNKEAASDAGGVHGDGIRQLVSPGP